jgi:hypothetical protein
MFQGQYNTFEDLGSTLGFYHMGQRFEQPGIERWTQPDPKGADLADPLTIQVPVHEGRPSEPERPER